MDKSVILAVAGSGKTSRLIESLDEVRRFLVVTYTESNRETIRKKVIDRFGFFPTNITLYTYFRFLHGFCYRPFLRTEKDTRGLTFMTPSRYPIYKLRDDRRYMASNRRLYANRLAKFIEQCGCVDAVVSRLEKYFDVLLVDEVQDFAGHDFNFLMAISAASMDVTLLGDYFQHTFDTSRDGSVNRSLHDDYAAYQARFANAKLRVDTHSLKKSRRCSKTVCEFITQNLGVAIESSDDRESIVRFTDDPDEVLTIYQDRKTVKLFYQDHHKYSCFSHNWGASKGIDHYHDVCIVLNPTSMRQWNRGSLLDVNIQTRNKLYVACSRARGNLTFIPEALIKRHKRL